MMKSNKREDYRSARTWLAALKRDELWRMQMKRIFRFKQLDLYRESEEMIKELYNGIPAFYWRVYRCHPERVATAIEELWHCDDLSLWEIKVVAICYLTLELFDKMSGINLED